MRQTFAEFEPMDFSPMNFPEGGSRLPRFQLVNAAELKARPEMRFAVRHVLPEMGLAAFYGASGSGKSYLMLNMAACLGEAYSWFGHGIARVHDVVILVLEGEAGFRRRVVAWEMANQREFPKRVRFIFEPFNLLEGSDLSDLTTAIEISGGCDVLFIDTLNRATPGADENSARDASTMLANLGWLQRTLDGLVVVVHHSGKDESRGMRGHSSMFAAMDAVIEVRRAAGMREWSLAKSKDDIDGVSHPFTLEQVTIARDFMDEAVTSCVVRSIDAPTERAPQPPKGGNQRVVYDALLPLFKASTAFGKAGAPPTRPCLALDQAVEAVKGHLVVDQKRQAERARLAIQGMTGAGILGHSEGWIWMR